MTPYIITNVMIIQTPWLFVTICKGTNKNVNIERNLNLLC